MSDPTPLSAFDTRAVTSQDGTIITYRSYGAGPPVMLVHGAFNTSKDYRAVGDLLAPHHEVVLIDRRGYGATGLGPAPGRFTQDGDDIAAVLTTLKQPVVLFGHSAGAIAVMHAARAARSSVRQLTLYEPAGPAPAAQLDRFRQLRQTAGVAAAVAAFIAAGGGPDENELASALEQPAWADRLLLADAVERDLTAQVAYPTTANWSDLNLPLQILIGSQTQGPTRIRAEHLARSLPLADLVTLPGQGHLANMLAPELVAEALQAQLQQHRST